jgi:hypothetical protein
MFDRKKEEEQALPNLDRQGHPTLKLTGLAGERSRDERNTSRNREGKKGKV